ncbi:putative membrane-anchored protein [Streptosporangium becharense]|uniref:Putative membrane-anchored protein n=1 Tax=Streptosporangium becharense TaxID=1816182 RepID=A0A7W9IL63_9ACTN|nr:hypothetical protein [Streptosporangium becharense]MBB2913160.1 putative membrane-anchored protein [Streptosporangium becharense]MBB5822143.1 putative membrane-anchored protein [Streptosporangium becharense]
MTLPEQVDEMPPDVRTARRLMWVQIVIAVVGFLLLVLLVFFAGGFAAEGISVTTDVPTSFYAGVAFIMLMGVLAANLATRKKWIRNLAAVLEALLILNQIYLWITAGLTILSLFDFLLAVVVITQLYGRHARRWFDR